MSSAQTSAAPPVQQSDSTAARASGTSPAAAASSQQSSASPSHPTQRSYAHATRHSLSAVPLVVGAPQHGKSDSVTATKTAANMAAPPVVGGPPTGPSAPSHEHSRKPSVTISASGSSGQMPNGAPAAPAARHNISFGAMNAGGQGPAIANSNSYHQSSSSLSATQGDPRVTSPTASPSPIPQPAASGGRPPDRPQAQNNGLNFGSMAEGQNPAVHPPGAGMAPQNNAHFRRASSQSQHSEAQGGSMPMSPGVGRGGYMNGPPRGGRGSYGGYGASYSPGPGYRAMQTPPRNGPGGVPAHFQGQIGPHPGSPHGGPPRSPAPMGSQPGTPTMSHMHPYPSYQGFNQQLPSQPHHFQPQSEFQQQYGYYGQPYPMHPGYMQGPPQTPRTPGYKGQPPMAHQQYGHQSYNQPPSQSMSRTSSQVSERPASSIGSAHPIPSSTPSNNQVSHGHSQSTSAATQGGANFQIPARVNKSIVIKTAEGEVLNFDKKPSPAPPATTPSPAPASAPAPAPAAAPAHPVAPSPAPAVVSSTPPPTASAPGHSRSESRSSKSVAEIRQEFMNSVKKEQEKDVQPVQEDLHATAPSETKSVVQVAESEQKHKSTAENSEFGDAAKQSTPSVAEPEASVNVKSSAEAEDSTAGAAGDKSDDKSPAESEEERKKREDDEFERMVAEMEAREREEQEKEKAFQVKRKQEVDEAAARKKEEADNADEKMKQAEREAEAREEERERKRSKEEEQDDKNESQRLFDTLKKTNLGPAGEESQASDSRASTPATSDRDSMPPPSRTSKSAGISRAKPPAALKLETSKAVEPAQPTPGMRSLRSARMLQLQSESISYPEGIQSPNPALNQSGRRGGRLYDTSFLVQFQEAFKEKPSLDWDQKVKETLGDPSDGAPKSARPPQTPGGGRGGRTPSQTFPQQGMGNFAAGNRRPMGPPGQMGGFDPPKMGNPISGQFGAGRAFPGPGMARPPSQNLGQMNTSQRGPSNRGSRAGSKMTFKQQDQANQKMPLTANADLKPLEASGSGWKPMSFAKAPAPSESGNHMAPDMVQRKVKSNLNKMTPERFEKIAGQIMEIAAQSRNETDGRTLRQVIALTFEKACDEAHWASMYAQFCQRMLQEMSNDIKDENVTDKGGNPVVGGTLFRKYLLNRCQEEFERGWVVNLPENPEGQSDEAAMLSDEYYKAAAAKRKGLGLVQFIGELYKLRMLSVKIMHQCVTKLLDFEGEPDEAAIESFCKLLRTVGGPMEAEPDGPRLIKIYFERIDKIMSEYKLASRLHFMLLDVTDLKRSGWRDKDSQKGPKTIQQIHEEALAAQQKADAERQRQNQRGGGRMPSGRQDSRNFSNPPPPQDYNRNTLGTDDLRKLNQKSRETRLGPSKSLGPSTMLGSRSSSGRQGFGPPTGLLSRSESQAGSSPGGSGMHSRTASIKADTKKDEETKTSANAFSALAGMDGEEAFSPSATKSQPTTEGAKPE